jgi:hypothetical protein
VGKVAQQTKALLLFGTVGVNVAGIRWKDIALIRGGLTDALNSFYYERCAVTTNREKSAEVIVAELSITLREGLNLN